MGRTGGALRAQSAVRPVQPELEVSSDTLLDALLRPDLRVGTSTPKADPSGDYAWALFEKAEKLRPGSFALLSGKALQLTGGAQSEKAPEGTNQYGWVMAGKKADLFLTYCTNAVLARKEVPALRIVRVPEALSVGADYGLVVRSDASGEAWRLALYILAGRTKDAERLRVRGRGDAEVTRPGADDRTGFPLLRIGPARNRPAFSFGALKGLPTSRGPGVCGPSAGQC